MLDIGVYGARGIPSTYSGYETFLTAMLPELVRRGHEVTVYCRRAHFTDDQPFEGVRRVLLPALRSYRWETVSHGVSASVVARLRRHSVVFVTNIANAPVCLAARGSRQRTVLNTDGQEWLRGKWGRGARAYWRACAHLSGWSASALVADSEGMARVYRDDFRSRSTVIPYCWTGLVPVDVPSTALEALSLEPYRYFLVAARLNPENSVAEIARSYARSGSHYPLVVLGTANYESPVFRELQRLAEGCTGLRIGGHVADRRTFATLVAHSAAYLHGHRVGGTNPSLVEAMGCGANVIALDTPFNREVLGPAGAYFSDFEAELRRIMASTQACPVPAGEGQREAARQRCRTRFSADAVVDAYEELFRQVDGRDAWAKTVMATTWSGAETERQV